MAKSEVAISSVHKEAGLEVVAHKIQNLGAVVVCLDANAASSAVAEAVGVDLQRCAGRKVANRTELELKMD